MCDDYVDDSPLDFCPACGYDHDCPVCTGEFDSHKELDRAEDDLLADLIECPVCGYDADCADCIGEADPIDLVDLLDG